MNLSDRAFTILTIGGMVAAGINITFFLGTIFDVSVYPPFYEDALARHSIEDIQKVKRYIDSGDYERATEVLDAVSTYMWILRNTADTSFYDRVYWDSEADNVEIQLGLYADYNTTDVDYNTKAIETLTRLQMDLCPKTDYNYFLQFKPFNPEATVESIMTTERMEGIKLCYPDLELSTTLAGIHA